MNVNEIITSIKGFDSKGLANCSVSSTCELWNANTQAVKEVQSYAMRKPSVEIQRRGDYVQIDFEFISSLDSELKILWGALEEYGRLMSEVTESSIELPNYSIAILPHSGDENYYLMAVNPIFWTVQPKVPGMQTNIIRTVFNTFNFFVMEADALDFNEAEAEAKREIDYNESLEFTGASVMYEDPFEE